MHIDGYEARQLCLPHIQIIIFENIYCRFRNRATSEFLPLYNISISLCVRRNVYWPLPACNNLNKTTFCTSYHVFDTT